MLIRAKHLLGLLSVIVPCIIACCFLRTGCVKRSMSRDSVEQSGGNTGPDMTLALEYTRECIDARDRAHFVAGRPKKEVLEAIGWRGTYLVAAWHDGANVEVIRFQLFCDSECHRNPYNAIFIDGKFARFVAPLEPGVNQPANAEWLALISASNAVDVNEVESENQKKPCPPEEGNISPVVLPFVWYLTARVQSARERNAQLRAQFNAEKIDLGMSQQDVEAVFHAKALEAGKCEGGEYAIYGSSERYEWESEKNFDNVLIFFRDGAADQIYCQSAKGTPREWRDRFREVFPTLPEQLP